jgi:hypothetical protein
LQNRFGTLEPKIAGFGIARRLRGWRHPIHIHFEQGQILNRNGVAPRLIRGSGTQPRCREARARESAVRFAVAHLEKAISSSNTE